VVGRIGALECRSEPLGRSDRRPTGGADEREEVVPADEKRVYIFYTRQCGGTRLGLNVRRKKVAETAGELLKNTNIS